MESGHDSGPARYTAEAPSPGKSTPNTRHAKRNHRQRKDHTHSLPALDGAVSDSVANIKSSPHFQNTPRQRRQSGALGAAPNSAQHVKPSNDHRQRPASHGGSMLPNTPLKEQAYAGPTFQTSPAPSSLPVPKFFSRSVPNVAAQSLAQRMEAERTPEKESSPEPDIVFAELPDRDSQKSPLDVFFKADRQEKDRTRTRSGLSPELVRTQVAPSPQTAGGQQPRENIFLQDLNDGNKNLTSQSRFPVPNGHPQHNRSLSSSSNAEKFPPSASILDAESDRDAQTQALKALLFNNINNPQPQFPQNNTPPRAPPNSRTPNRPADSPSPFQRSASGPSTPVPNPEYQQYNQNYHYGNQRNLSPLFKAASGRNETPSARPSGLRVQESATSPTNTASNQQPPRVIDPNSFSRDYIQTHIKKPGVPGTPPYNSWPNPTAAPAPLDAPHDDTQANGSTTPSRSAPDNLGKGGAGKPARDVQGMEDDLRRMLNLKVLSN